MLSTYPTCSVQLGGYAGHVAAAGEFEQCCAA